MSQPLTLDEVGVAPADAAQVIYDLRRENQRLREAVRPAAGEADTKESVA